MDDKTMYLMTDNARLDRSFTRMSNLHFYGLLSNKPYDAFPRTTNEDTTKEFEIFLIESHNHSMWNDVGYYLEKHNIQLTADKDWYLTILASTKEYIDGFCNYAGTTNVSRKELEENFICLSQYLMVGVRYSLVPTDGEIIFASTSYFIYLDEIGLSSLCESKYEDDGYHWARTSKKYVDMIMNLDINKKLGTDKPNGIKEDRDVELLREMLHKD